MNQLSRRTFFKHAGAVAAIAGTAVAGGGAIGVLSADPADAATPPTYEGYVFDEGGQVFDIKNPVFGDNGGAQGNTVLVAGDGSIMAGSASFNWTGGTFQSGSQPTGDVGKVITIQGAGPSGTTLSTTIVSYLNPTHVLLDTAASTTVSLATFAYGSDDTSAITAAVAAAQAASVNGGGRVYAPPGAYTILGGSNDDSPIDFTGTGGLVGCGAKAQGSALGNTVFLCSDATAGILANGSATYEGFMVYGNNIANSPMQNGSIVDDEATTVSSNASFFDIWIRESAGNGWTIYGSQKNTYRDCRSTYNLGYGLDIDGGAGDLDFWDWQESDNTNNSINGGNSITGGDGTYGDHTENIHFYGGICDGEAITKSTPKVSLVGATRWSFSYMYMCGGGINGPATVIDQSTCSGIDFTGCVFQANHENSNPGYASIQVIGDAPGEPTQVVITDGAWFFNGDNSVYIENPSSTATCSAIGWFFDNSKYGPYGGSGPGIDTLLVGREGSWQSASVTEPPWSGTVTYRVDADGLVRLKGSVTAGLSGGSGEIFTLGAGYLPPYDLELPVWLSTGAVGYITISHSTGVVSSGQSLTLEKHLYFDGISFPTS